MSERDDVQSEDNSWEIETARLAATKAEAADGAPGVDPRSPTFRAAMISPPHPPRQTGHGETTPRAHRDPEAG